jgi:hypothetical protein
VDARARYDEITGNADVPLGNMLGMLCIKTGGRLIVSYSDEEPMAAHAHEWSQLAQAALTHLAG